MGIVMFHHICDACGKHGEEYTAMAHCSECMDDVCENCLVPGSWNHETGRAMCKSCDDESKEAA